MKKLQIDKMKKINYSFYRRVAELVHGRGLHIPMKLEITTPNCPYFPTLQTTGQKFESSPAYYKKGGE